MNLISTSRKVLLAFSILLFIQIDLGFAAKFREILPEQQQGVLVEGKKKSSTYFKVEPKQSLTLKVVGPGTLKVFTRAELPSKSKETVYGLVAVRDNEKRYLLSRSTKLSSLKVKGSEGTRIGEARSIKLKVPSGAHEFSFEVPKDEKNDLFLRFAFAEKAPKVEKEPVKYVPYFPRKPSEEVRIIVKEEEYIYYRVTKDLSTEIEIIGPAKVKVVSRLEFDPSMRGQKPYRVEVKKGSEIEKTIPFQSKISATATYRSSTTFILGQGNTFYINVPPGKQRYTLSCPDKGHSVLLRFYLPEKSLGNELKTGEESGKVELKGTRKSLLKG